MLLPDPASISRDLPLGEGCLVELARRVSSACREAIGAHATELWLWRIVAPDEIPQSGIRSRDERRLVRIARSGPDGERTEDLDAIARELEGAIDERVVEAPLIARSGAGREVRCLLGVVGVFVLLQDMELPESRYAELRSWLRRIEELVVDLLPSRELAEINHWLLERGNLDRQAARAFARVRTIADLGRAIDAHCTGIAPATYSGLYFIDPESGLLRLVFARGLTEEERVAAERTAWQRHPGRVIRTSRPIDIPDNAFLDDEARRMPPGHGREVRARLFLPVIAEGRTVGTIGFAGPEPWSFNHRHRQVLAMLADFAGLAYGRIEAESRSARRGRLLEATGTAAERLLGAVEWRPVAFAALALVGTALDAETVLLLQRPLQGSAEHPLEFVWQSEFGEPWPHVARIAGLSAEEIRRLARDESVDLALDSAAGGAERVATVKPVLVDGALWGVIACVPKQSVMRGFDRIDRFALRTLAGHFATAIARERLHSAAEHQHRMQAVGQLASGIASDFNDLLWPILLYTEVLDREGQLDDRGRKMVSEMRKSARDASELVQQVLAIARRRDRQVELVRPSDVAIELTHLLRRMATPGVRIEARIDADSGLILGDRAALEQALLTIGTNAVEAVRDRPGTVVVEVEIIEQAGSRWMRIAISDDGPGLSESARAHIFDPYFKEVEGGEGTDSRSGLGLSLVRQAVADMDGRIVVESELGRGTRFELCFPKVAGEGSAGLDSATREDAAPAAEAPSARPRILFVDDDALVLAVGREMLDALGYEVATCANPADALLRIEADMRAEQQGGASRGAFNIVLTDLTMPGMTGIELAREIRRRGFSMPIVCCTGYVDPVTERSGLEAGMSLFVRKPIELDRLGAALSQAMTGSVA